MDVKKPQRLRLVPHKEEPEVPKPAQKIKRSDSLTGLTSLHKGVSELETLVAEQRNALTQAIDHMAKQDELFASQQIIVSKQSESLTKQQEQIEEQARLIKAYETQLEEHDQVLTRIIEG